MTYGAEDFLQAFHALLPTGPVWPRGPDTIQSPAFLALVQIWARLAARDENLLVDAFPATAVELLPEWEASLGLPDPCAGESPTITQRQQQVVARLTDSGGSSVPYYVQLAARLGFTITVREYAPARAGTLRCGDPLCSPDWAYVWTVTYPGYTPRFFLAGTSRAGDPLRSWGNAVLRCELAARAPAHTLVQFAQSD